MLYKRKDNMVADIFINRKVYIELTNPVHGGEGWDFGSKIFVC